jgi:hypothetical protein
MTMLVRNPSPELNTDVEAATSPKGGLKYIVRHEALAIDMQILGGARAQYYPEPLGSSRQASEHSELQLPHTILCSALNDHLEIICWCAFDRRCNA